jgi:hypothetical protein
MSGTSHPIVRGGPLADVSEFPRLVRDWLAGKGDPGDAKAEWAACLTAPPPDAPAPAWADASWRESWWSDFAADLPDEAATGACRRNMEALATGTADAVVTGQQPGFLGGPLYTLYKTAACVAAAAARTAAGRPTIPLFWSGDDDDDLREAFAPALFDPRRRSLLRPAPPEVPVGRSVGDLPAALAGAGEAAWLAEQASRTTLAGRLAEDWRAAVSGDGLWRQLQRRGLMRLFGADGLLVVSGDDTRLHAVAEPLYARMLADVDGLSAAAARQGERFVAAGYHAQIGAQSLAAPFNVADGGRRRRLGAGDAPPDDLSRLRPGVLLRAPVQDWLFRPVGVVVGPAEVAYLKQIEPLYAALDLARPPLVPRLFCTLADAADVKTGDGPDPAAASDDALARMDEAAARTLHTALAEVFGLSDVEARERAAPNLERWSARNRALFARLARAAGGRNGRPLWLDPGARRQERVLAMHWATALWGAPLVEAVLAAASAHLEAGAAGAWSEWRIIVTDPEAA